MGFDAGRVDVGLGFDYDDRGADRFERRYRDIHRMAGRDIRADARIDVDQRGFDRYDRNLRQAEHHADRAGRSADGFGRSTGQLRGAVGLAATGIGGLAVGLGAIGVGLAKATQGYTEHMRVVRQTEAVVKSTKGAAKVTADEVSALSDQLERKTTIDGDVIQSGANMLLTFTNIRNEVGKGNNVFDQAVATANDMAAAMGGDTKASAIQLGKALNDPIKGITALSKVGVAFTEEQKEQITTLVESGKTLDAQKIILKELSKEFGGSAEAAATPTQRLMVRLRVLGDEIGERMVPALDWGSKKLTEFIDGFGQGDSTITRWGRQIMRAGEWVRDAYGDVKRWAGRLLAPVRDEFRDFTGALAGWQRSYARYAKRIWNAIASVFSGEDSKGITRDLSRILEVGLRILTAFYKNATWILDKIGPGVAQMMGGIARQVRGFIRIISGLLSGDWGKVWDGVKDVAAGGLRAIRGLLSAAVAPFRNLGSRIGRALLGNILDATDGVLGAIEKTLRAASKLPGVGKKFAGLADDVAQTRRNIGRYRDTLESTDRQHNRMPKNVRDLRESVGALRERLSRTREGTAAYRETAERLRKKQRQLNEAMEDARDKGRTGARGISRIGASAAGASQAVTDAAGSIKTNLSRMAKSLGVKVPDWKIEKAARTASAVLNLTPSAAGATGGRLDPTIGIRRFFGGGIPNPGSGTRDDHLVIGPDGVPIAAVSGTEGMINTPQMGVIDRVLAFGKAFGQTAFGSLKELWSSGMKHYAGGGAIRPVPGFPGESAASSVIPAIRQIAKQFGLILTDAYGQGHQSPGHTKYGTAADFAGPDAAMDRAVRYLVGKGYLVGYDGRYGSKDWPGHGPRNGQGGGNAHLHVELGGKGGNIGSGDLGGAESLTTPKITGPASPLRDIVRAAARKLTGGANRWIEKNQPDMGLGMPSLDGVSGKGGAPSANQALGRKMMLAAGFDAAQWPFLKELWTRESGWSTTADNPTSDAYGIPQALPGSKMASAGADWATSARTQIKWGLGYIKGRYKTPSGAIAFHNAHNWYAGGGQLPKFDGGGKLGGKKKKVPFRERALERAGAGADVMRVLRGTQSDRNATFERITSALENDGKVYGLQERKNDLTDEVFVDEDTGAVNVRDVKRRVGELKALEAIKKRMVDRLAKARVTASRVRRTYNTILGRLRRALKAATAGKRGKSSKARKAAAASYRKRIADYEGKRDEWGTKVKDVGFDLEDARIDLQALSGERASVAGTKAEPKDSEETTTDDSAAATDVEQSASADIGTGDTADTGATAVEQAPPSAEDIARGVAEQLASYTAGRQDLFASFGSNFVRSQELLGMSPAQQEAGLRYFGGGAGGTDGGVLAGAGGAQGGGIVQNVNVTLRDTRDTHVLTQSLLFDLQAAMR